MASQQEAKINGIDVTELQAFMDAMRLDPGAGALAIRTRHAWEDGGAIAGSGDELEIAGEVLGRAHHTLRTDFPRELGGGDSGPVPGEALLGALGGCVASGFVELAALRGVEVEAVEVAIEAHVDLRGTYGIASVPARPSEITMTLRVRADADEATLAELGMTSQQQSPVADTITHPVSLRLSVQRMT